MMKRLVQNSLGAVTLALLFMTVACSHTKRTVSQLDELSPEVNQSASVDKASESVTDSAKVEETVSAATAEVEAPAEVAQVSELAETADVAQAPEAQVSEFQNSEFQDSEVQASEEVAAVESPAETVVASESTPSEPVLDSKVSNAADVLSKVDDFKVEAPAAVPMPEPSPSFMFETEKTAAIDLKTVENDLAPSRKRVRKPKKLSSVPPASEVTAQVKVEEKPKVVAEAPKPEPKVEEAPKPELASSDLSSIIEKNLLWVAFGIVGGVVAAFVTIRNRKKSDPLG